MNEEECRYVGRITRGHNVIAMVEPVARAKEGADWTLVQDATRLFPPKGYAELRGAIVADLHDGDLVIFQPAPQTVKQSSTSVRATSTHRLARLLDLDDDPERLRRLLVETGLEGGRAGTLAVKVGKDGLVLVAMVRCDDQRLRAAGKNLGTLPLRIFDPDRVLRVPSESGSWYQVDPADSTIGVLNWARDDQYVASLIRLLANGDEVEEAAKVIERALRDRADQLTGRIALLGGADAAILAEVARSEALASRIRVEAEVASSLLGLVLSNAAVQEKIDERVAAKVANDMPSLIAAERVRVEADVQATWDAKRAGIEADLAILESEGLEALEAKVAAVAVDVDARVAAIRGSESSRIKAEIEAHRERRDAEVARIDHSIWIRTQEEQASESRTKVIQEELVALESQRLSLTTGIEELRETNAELLRTRAQLLPVGQPRLDERRGERILDLGDIVEEARRLGLLTDGGTDALIHLVVYLAAGEVPILHGADAMDLVEMAGALLAGGRMAVLEADPTTVTVDDLWSRPGSSGPTPLGSAVRWAMCEDAGHALGVVSRAERSGARFWYPALSRSRLQGLLPQALLLCVVVDDAQAEEVESLLREPFVIEAKGCFKGQASIAAYAAAESLRTNPSSMSRAPLTVQMSDVVELLARCGPGLKPTAMHRLARVQAAASKACGDHALTLVDAAAAMLGAGAGSLEQSNAPKPYVVRHAANA